jgi:hypothetical protein
MATMTREDVIEKEVSAFREELMDWDTNQLSLLPETGRLPWKLMSSKEKSRRVGAIVLATAGLLGATAYFTYVVEKDYAGPAAGPDSYYSPPQLVSGDCIASSNVHNKYIAPVKGYFDTEQLLSDIGPIPGENDCSQQAVVHIIQSFNPFDESQHGTWTSGTYQLPNSFSTKKP